MADDIPTTPDPQPIEQAPASFETPSEVLAKPVETQNLFPLPVHTHDNVNSPSFPVGNLQGSPMYKLADVTSDAAATSFESKTFSAKNILKIYIYINGRSASTGINLQFNGDTASNYIWRQSYGGGTYPSATTASAFSAIDITSGASSITFSLIEIFNIKDHQKFIWGRSYEYLVPDPIPINIIDNAGVWKNETDYITSVKVLSDAAQTFGQNSRLIIYGA
ncbi:MAG: hypothetical protein M3362_00305 [Acidobacteriota bacterium]|nr:hypothetical protein [Acidobacteriota bacterium]